MPTCFLFDNGSLRPASTLRLREVASRLAEKLGAPVEPVSLLHSSGIDPAELGDRPAELLEPALLRFFGSQPDGQAVLLPLFFGPSGALIDYLPERLLAVTKKFPQARIHFGRWLVDANNGRTEIASALADAARKTIAERQLRQPSIVLVDHGSPQREVAAVRDHLAEKVDALLAGETAGVFPASMERRAGAEYDFNEPLLATRLRTPPCAEGDVVVLLQFLSPGRHAGEGGDIAEICTSAEKENPRLRTHRTEPIGLDGRVIEVLARRYAEALQANFFGSIKPTSSA